MYMYNVYVQCICTMYMYNVYVLCTLYIIYYSMSEFYIIKDNGLGYLYNIFTVTYTLH